MLTEEIRKNLYTAFSPDIPVPANDPRYIDCSEVRNVKKLLKQMERKIRFADTPIHQLLSGHRGCGKTSELKQLIAELSTGNTRYFVVYCEADRFLDLQDVTSFDVLLAVAGNVTETVEELGIPLLSSTANDFWQNLWNGLGDTVNITNVKLQAPSIRSQVRKKIAEDTFQTYLDAINAIINSARRQLRECGYADLVVVVDNLDRVVGTPIPNTNTNLQEELFITNAPHLIGLNCFVIYTLPPALMHSLRGAMLPTLFNVEPQMLPMVPVKTRTGDRYQPGIDKLMEVLNSRITQAGATFEEVFDTRETAEQLCEVSGGYIRGLMNLMRSAMTFEQGETAPVPERIALLSTTEISHARHLVGIPIASNTIQSKILQRVQSTKQKVHDQACIELLDNVAILCYFDDFDEKVWWDINPVVIWGVDEGKGTS